MVSSYDESCIIRKIKKRKRDNLPLKVAFLDIDATMTGSKHTTNMTRQRLEQLGYAIVFVTSRTEEMMLSEKAYNRSVKKGLDRPAPKLGVYNGKHVYAPPEQVEAAGILDPDIIAGSTGTHILVRQHGGWYTTDNVYEEQFGTSSEEWRKQIIDVINQYNTNGQKAYPADYESSDKYNNGLVNIYPPKFRIVLYFQSSKEKTAFRQYIRQAQPPLNLRINDDSHPSKEKHVLCLTPRHGSKRRAVDRIISTVCAAASVERSELEILIAGDSLPDLDMGMRAAKGTNATFFLVGGSRLAHALTCAKEHIEILEKQLCEMKLCMKALKNPGYYSLIQQESFVERQIIVGDEACQGSLAVESMLRFLPKVERD
jgi:hydroxymethylpyrimidine pyrophosphatase-like HAD family hydrolase